MFPGEPFNSAVGISALGPHAPPLPSTVSSQTSPLAQHQDPTTTVHSPQVTHDDGASKTLPLAHSAWNPPSEPLNSASNPGCCQLQGYGRVALVWGGIGQGGRSSVRSSLLLGPGPPATAWKTRSP